MKKNYLFSLLLGSALLCSCNNNDDVLGGDSNQNEGVKDAYLSLSIQLPSGSIKTRAGGVTPTPGENGDGHEIGEDSENQVESVLVFGFPQNAGGAAFKKKINIGEMNELGKDINDVKSYKTKEPFQVSAGTYHLYVMVNPTSKMENYSETLGEAKFKDEEIKMSEIQDADHPETFSHFPMSSADEIVETVITSAHTKSHPAFFTTKVQRMFAKVLFTATKNEDFGVNGKNKAAFADKFVFLKYGIVNQRNTAYWFRRAGQANNSAVIGKKEDGANYVIDPIFDQKNKPYAASVAEANYWDREVGSPSASYWHPIDMSNVQYCFENTMKKEAQLQGYTTGLVLEAQFNPKSGTIEEGLTITFGDTFFSYNNKYYATHESLVKALPSVKSLSDFDAKYDGDQNEAKRLELIKEYDNHGVKVYYKGKCYYHYWIRHANNGNNSDMGIMEFATVRNNVYKMSVNSVKLPGNPIPPVTPERPDEDTEVYLDVKAEVLPWVIRENSMDL